MRLSMKSLIKKTSMFFLAIALSSCGNDDGSVESCINVGSNRLIDTPLKTVIKNDVDNNSEIISTTKMLREISDNFSREEILVSRELYDTGALVDSIFSKKIVKINFSVIDQSYLKETNLEIMEDSSDRFSGNIRTIDFYEFSPEKTIRHKRYCKNDFYSDAYTVKREFSTTVEDGEPFVENFNYEEKLDSNILSVNQPITINNKEYASIRESVTFFDGQGNLTKREERWIDVSTGEHLRVDSYRENNDTPYESITLDSIE